jgi:hypothetical protein
MKTKAINFMRLVFLSMLMLNLNNAHVVAQSEADSTIYTFEEGIEGWEADFGASANVETSTVWAVSGNSSLSFEVDFQADTVGAVRRWNEMDLSAYEKIEVIVGHESTEAAILAGIFLSEGGDINFVEGPLTELDNTNETTLTFNLNELIREAEGDISQIHQIGVAIRSQESDELLTVYIDDVTLVASQTDGLSLPVTFEGSESIYAFNDFGGNATVLSQGPEDETNMVAITTKQEDAEDWAGTALTFENQIPFSEEELTMSVRVYSPVANSPVMLKMEGSDNFNDVEVQATVADAETWTTLTFDYSEAFEGEFDRDYPTVSIFFNYYGEDIGTADFMWDDLKMGSSVETNIEKPGTDMPGQFTLKQNYPNPFNPTTRISYELPQSATVSLTVHNIAGKKVATLVNSRQSAGSKEVQFDAKNLSSGIYFYRIQAGSFMEARRMVLIK